MLTKLSQSIQTLANSKSSSGGWTWGRPVARLTGNTRHHVVQAHQVRPRVGYSQTSTQPSLIDRELRHATIHTQYSTISGKSNKSSTSSVDLVHNSSACPCPPKQIAHQIQAQLCNMHVFPHQISLRLGPLLRPRGLFFLFQHLFQLFLPSKFSCLSTC